MALLGSPQNIPTSFTNLSELIDEIWFQCGDQTNDYSWYTKRALLTGVYISTELFMLTDRSKDYKETWEFLDRRLADFVCADERQQDVEQMLGTVTSSLSSFVSTLFSNPNEQKGKQTPAQTDQDTVFIEKVNPPTDRVEQK